MKRSSIERQTALAMAAVVVLAVLVAALTTTGLVRSTARTEARKALVAQADLAASVLAASAPGDVTKTLRVLRAQRTPTALRGPGGQVRGDALATSAYTALGKPARSGSRLTTVDGREVLVELRTLPTGSTLVLAQRTNRLGVASPFLGRMLIGLGVGVLVAVVAAAWFARRLSHPLRDTAAAAHRLAAGERAVRVPVAGPLEVAEVGESVNTLAGSLERSEARQRDFLMSVSHELRTPLTAIRGFGEALADGVTTGAAVPRAGAVVVDEARRLERLVGDLLDLARAGASDFRVERVRVDLRALLADAATVWSARSAAVGVRFAAELPDAPVWVLTDPSRLRQVVDGLAENALRVSPTGAPLVLALRVETTSGYTGSSPPPDGSPGVAPGVAPGAAPGAGVAVVEVRDGGPGLTADDMAVAFERSALHDRYQGVRRVGTGLGLALVKALADGLGAEATVGSAPAEGGTCFAVRLPLP